MRFATRIFLSFFVPLAALLAVGFWAVRGTVMSTVREGLRASVRENQVALAREQARNEMRNRRLLQGIAENPTLKAGLQLLTTERRDTDQALNTIQDQLSEFCNSLGFDYMLVSAATGEPLAAVVRDSGGFTPVNATGLRTPELGFFSAKNQLYEVFSVPIDEGGAQVATLTVGDRFDVTRFGVPAVLLHQGAVIAGQTKDVSAAQIEKALAMCAPAADCEIGIQDQAYLSLPLGLTGRGEGNGYTLRSLQNVDAASAPLRSVLQRVFLVGGFAAMAAILGISVVSSRSIARPLVGVAAHLRRSASTGELHEFPESQGGVQEIQDLTRGFNHAAKAVREGRERLTRAYVQFVGSLAQALEARDAYTAGHSRRVSEYACAIAQAMNVPQPDLETIRVGALLHDLGKIGISDLVLQKPGRLTPEEEQLIRQHPVIGRRILENVRGLEAYLDIVELHHEDWDGAGYPYGLKSEETPLLARIVKVADAYDAMTSDRPYRKGMNHAEALAVLRKASGSQMDASVVEAFALLGDQRRQPAAADETRSLLSFSLALRSSSQEALQEREKEVL